MTPDEIEKLGELATKATPGPWVLRKVCGADLFGKKCEWTAVGQHLPAGSDEEDDDYDHVTDFDDCITADNAAYIRRSQSRCRALPAAGD